MIELRIVEHELGVKPEIQYRFVLSTADASVPFMNTSMNFIMPNSFVWSEWKTCPYVKAEEIENKQLTEYLKEVLNPPDNVELSVYDEDNNEKDLSNGIVNVWIEENQK